MTQLDFITLASLVLIFLGTVIMAGNILLFQRLMDTIKACELTSNKTIQRTAFLPKLLMIFFLLGYAAVFFALLAGELMISTIFLAHLLFFGAIFVLTSTRFQAKTVDLILTSQEQATHNSLHDQLTGLANRNLIRDRLGQIIDRAARSESAFYAVLFMNLDRFKLINDSLGHAVGDGVLQEVAKRLTTCVRNMDTVARFGGDEFVVVLDGTNPRKTIKVIKRIRESMAAPFRIKQHVLTITSGFGIYYGPTAHEEPELVLQNSQLAMHQAKTRGPGRFKVFRTAMLDRAVRAIALEHDLLRGLRNEEFVAYFQPVISLTDPPALVGFEALARWEHPTKGQVSPLLFIPLAETNGLILDLGKQIFRQACQLKNDLTTALGNADHLHVAVNLSMLQLNQSFIDQQFIRMTEDAGVAPSQITLEVTESILMDQMDQAESAIQRLARLRDQGFAVAIDDFGTGYSSFAYLKDLPATHIKIDRAFIHGLAEDTNAQKIVKSMINMGHSLSMTVVAEGIENLEQLQLLKSFGCDYVQGFYYSKPLPPEYVVEFARGFDGSDLDFGK